MTRRLPSTGIKGCGKSSVTLTFYRIPVRAESAEGLGPLACGQQAATMGGRSGMLLCNECAKVNRIMVSGRLVVRQNRRGEWKRLYRM